MIFASNGAKLYICTTPQTSEPDQSGYEALTWVEASEVESIGQIGDAANEVTFTALGDGRTQRTKGSRDGGSIEVVMGADYADAGQVALIAAEKTIFTYAIKVEFNDAPSGPSPTPSFRYFLAIVGSANETVDSADNVIKLNCSLWINTAVTRVDADTGV